MRVRAGTCVSPSRGRRWSDYRWLGGEDPVFLRALAKTAREVGAEVRQWRVSFDPVPRDLAGCSSLVRPLLGGYQPHLRLPRGLVALKRKSPDGSEVETLVRTARGNDST
jgi:hypothetical protein